MNKFSLLTLHEHRITCAESAIVRVTEVTILITLELRSLKKLLRADFRKCIFRQILKRLMIG